MSIPRQKTPKDAFSALGAVCLLCALALAVAAAIDLADNVFSWEMFVLVVLSFVNGLALLWLGDWSDWVKTRLAHLEQDIPPPRDMDVKHEPQDSLGTIPRHGS